LRVSILRHFRLYLPLILLLLILGFPPASSAALPSLTGSTASKPVDRAQLNLSLDQVIQTRRMTKTAFSPSSATPPKAWKDAWTAPKAP
jgi:hypothetical protein